MTPSDLNQDNLTSPHSMGPGDRLKAARIEQGLSIEDVATRMHLSVGILEAIEENNFDDVTAPIFVKGYLRAYARIVSLDEDEMIQQYLNYYSDEDPPISRTGNVVPEISSEDARVKWTTYLVIIGLLGLLAVWWWNQYQIKTNVVSLGGEQIESVQQSTTDSDTAMNRVEPVIEASSAAVEETDVSLLTIEEPEAISLTEEPETQEVANSDQVEPDIVEIVQEDTIQNGVVQEDLAQEMVESSSTDLLSEDSSRVAPMGTEQLHIVIHADTWVDIKDASGYRLVYELLRADQKFVLTGKAPFSVFLGNGHGVELIYNDEIIDITPRIRDDNTAKVRIGS
jgi:cytoskeleton protein RodZ